MTHLGLSSVKGSWLILEITTDCREGGQSVTNLWCSVRKNLATRSRGGTHGIPFQNLPSCALCVYATEDKRQCLKKKIFYLYAIWTSDIPGVCLREPFVHLKFMVPKPSPRPKKNLPPQNIWLAETERKLTLQCREDWKKEKAGEGTSQPVERFHANIPWYRELFYERNVKKQEKERKWKMGAAMQKVGLLRSQQHRKYNFIIQWHDNRVKRTPPLPHKSNTLMFPCSWRAQGLEPKYPLHLSQRHNWRLPSEDFSLSLLRCQDYSVSSFPGRSLWKGKEEH